MRLLVVMAAALFVAQPVLACSPIPGGGDRVKKWNTPKAAAALFRAATTVELAVVERFSPDFDYSRAGRGSDAEARPWLREEGAVRVHYIVERRYKGLGWRRFTLNGENISPAAQVRGPVENAHLPWLPDAVDLQDGGFGGDCLVPAYARVGQRYLIFRDKRGRILNEHSPGLDERTAGPAYVPIQGPDDPWVRAVKRAAGRR